MKVLKRFDCVKSARFAAGEVTFTSVTGKTVAVAVCHEFLKSGQLG